MNEEIKKEFDALNDKVQKAQSDKFNQLEKAFDERMEKLNAQIQDGSKSDEALKTELKNITEKLNESLKAQGESQKHLDEMDRNIQKFAKGGAKHGKSLTMLLEEQKSGLEQIMNREISQFKLDGDISEFRLKVVGDMTSSANLTNDVAAQTRIPGVIYAPERPQHVREFIATGVIGTGDLRYIEETAKEGAVDVRQEGAAYSQSDVDLEEKSVTRKSIGTYLRVSREMLEDVTGLSAYLTQRFGKLLRVKEDQQLLFGTGLSGQVQGITTHSSVGEWTDTLADSNVNRFDVLAAAVVQGMVAHYVPNIIMIHPTDGQHIRLAKDTTGRYLFPQYAGGGITINGATVVESTAITSGTFLTGDFAQGCMLYDRRAPEILFSTENADDFVKDFVTIKINESVVFPIYRPDAFITGTFANALALGSA